MADFARSVLAGVAVGVFAAAVVKVNLFVIDKLVMINTLALETAVVMGMSTLETIKMRRQIAEVGVDSEKGSETRILNPKYTSPCLTTSS